MDTNSKPRKMTNEEWQRLNADARSYAWQQENKVPRNPSFQTEEEWKSKKSLVFQKEYQWYMEKEIESFKKAYI